MIANLLCCALVAIVLPSTGTANIDVLQYLVNPPSWVLEELLSATSPSPTVINRAENLNSSGQVMPLNNVTTAVNGRMDCGVRPMVPRARIVGGRRADYGKWPWQVLIREHSNFGARSANNRKKCSGVLISDRHVLTAAHCKPGRFKSLTVVLGALYLKNGSEPNEPVEKRIRRVFTHRNYVERTFENDLAILELETPVEFRPYIVPICLPTDSDGDFNGRKAVVAGWGKLEQNGETPDSLYEVDVPIMTNEDCQNMFIKSGRRKRIYDGFICAGYEDGQKDACGGDSGGPLMVEREDGRWTLVGTVSHGIRCAYPNMPGVYMRMTYYRPWIERVTGLSVNHSA